jgi:hypothetical protein
MFHMSSLKMGLDQAVLNGVEGSSTAEVSLNFVFHCVLDAFKLINEPNTP